MQAANMSSAQKLRAMLVRGSGAEASAAAVPKIELPGSQSINQLRLL